MHKSMHVATMEKGKITICSNWLRC